MVADPAGDRLDLPDRAEIEAAPPDEGVDGLQEIMADASVAGRLAGADEGGPLPRQRARFVIRDGGVDRERDRGDLRRRAKPQIDTEDIAVAVPLLEQLDHPLSDPHRSLPRLLARPARQRRRIEQE